MKKIFSLCLLMLVFALAACANDPAPAAGGGGGAATGGGTTAATGGDTAATGDVVTLRAVFPGDPPNDEANVLAEVNRRLLEDGYNFQINTVFVQDYWQNIALMIAGGEIVDVAWAHESTIADLRGRGVYQPIDEYVDQYAPNIMAKMPDFVRMQGSVDGRLYAIPRMIPMAQYNWLWNIRGDLREAWGVPEIRTLEDLEVYLQRALDEGMTPTADHQGRPLYPVFAQFFFPMGDNGRYPLFVDPNDSSATVQSFFESENWMNLVRNQRRWREIGFIAEDESHFGGNANEGFLFGAVAAVPSNTNSIFERIDSLVNNIPGAWIESIMLNPERRYVFQGGDNMLAVGSTSSNVREAVQFMDWIRASHENYDLWSHGIEGVNYNLNAAGAISFEGIDANMVYNPRTWMWNDMDLARFSANVSQEMIDYKIHWDDGAIVTPFVGFTIDQSGFASEFAQVLAVTDEYFSILVAGMAPNYEAVNEEFITQLYAAGLQTVIDNIQAQLNDFLN
ncbi:MAG: ABC transporter substrate-binding protein [Firmicutes bacterium]|nr:ABC transporter substrate-binding protein [Bacillota bacterium]